MALEDFLQNRTTHTGFKEQEDKDVCGLDWGIIKQDFEVGMQVAETSNVPHMDKHFKWMRGNQNCWTGWANSGKTQLTLALMMIKSLYDGWIWSIWSPEMRKANYVDGKVKVNYNRLAYELMAAMSGKTPFEKVHNEMGVPLLSLEERKYWFDWVKQHFIFLEPKDTTIDGVYDTFHRVYDKYGCDGFLVDPYKNIDMNGVSRDDVHLNRAFSRFQDLSIRTNASMNWIAHPKSGINRISTKDGVMTPVVCAQHHIAGGAAWENGMDGIYSVHAPNVLDDVKDPWRELYNLKERDQLLVAEKGVIKDIYFDVKARRYQFGGYDPISKSYSIPDVSSHFEDGDVEFKTF